MGNRCGFSSSSPPVNTSSSAPAEIDYKMLFGNINELGPLIDYIGEFLSRLNTEQPEPSTKMNSKMHDLVKNSIEDASKLMDGISNAGDNLGKDNFPSKLLRLPEPMTNVISGVLKEMGKLHWIVAGFSLIALVLDTIEQASSVSKKCVHLLEIMYNISKHLQILQERMPDEEERLNRATSVIVEGIIFCLCCMKQGRFFKYLFASIDEANLQNIETAMSEIYRELTLTVAMDTQEIAMDIRREIPHRYRPSEYEAPDYAVDTDSKVEEVIKLLDMEGKRPAQARAVVLYGFGGIGKTTLAKCVLPRLDLRGFKHCKVELDEKRSDLESYQSQLYEALTEKELTFSNYADGQQKLKEALEQESGRYFIFIDNVLGKEQINNLLPTKFSLPSSSMLRLLVTSRELGTVIPELHVLGRDVQCEKYHIQQLPGDVARSYFRKIVEGRTAISSDKIEIDDKIDAVVEECHGVPLLLTVYAKYLACNGHDPLEADEIIAALRKVDFKVQPDLTETLLYVFRKLSPEAQDAFVDICTYFHGWESHEISFIFGRVELRTLERGSLINIDASGKVVVHDVLRALAIKEGKETRIQSLHDFQTALRDGKKLDGVKEMWLLDDESSNMDRQTDEHSSFNLEDHHLRAMNDSLRVLALGKQTPLISACGLPFSQLRFLQAKDLEDPQILDGMHDLKYIKIMMMGFDIVPASPLKLWKDTKNLRNLQKFSFHSLRLHKFPPDFRLAPTLRDLDLSGCRLETLPSGFGNLGSLQSLDLQHCSRFEALPNDFGNLSALQALDMNWCHSLKSLPSGFGNLSSLQSLDLKGCKSLETLPNDFGNLSALQSLNLKGCNSLRSLPNGFGNLSSLQSLDLEGCERLGTMPNDFSNLSALQSLNLEGCNNLTSLPSGLANLSSLQSLDLPGCTK